MSEWPTPTPSAPPEGWGVGGREAGKPPVPRERGLGRGGGHPLPQAALLGAPSRPLEDSLGTRGRDLRPVLTREGGCLCIFASTQSPFPRACLPRPALGTPPFCHREWCLRVLLLQALIPPGPPAGEGKPSPPLPRRPHLQPRPWGTVCVLSWVAAISRLTFHVAFIF